MKKISLTLIPALFLYFPIVCQDLTETEEACPITPITFQGPAGLDSAQYQWDFCTGDLLETPEASIATAFIDDMNTLGGDAFLTDGLALALDGNNWYGFITNRAIEGENLIRADFGNSLDNIPTYTNLGIIGGRQLYNRPTKIRIAQGKTGNWYGFIVNDASTNFQGDNPGGSIVRLSFGNSLSNTPQAAFLDNQLDFPQGITIANDQGDLKLIVTDYPYDINTNRFNTTRINVYDFGDDWGNTPDRIMHTFPVFSAWGISVIRENGQWHGITVGSSSAILNRLTFGDNLNNTPTLKDITGSVQETNIREIFLQREANHLFAFGLGVNGNLIRIDFGASMQDNFEATNFGNLGLLGTQGALTQLSVATHMAYQDSRWYLFAIDRPTFVSNQAHQLIKVSFPDLCNALPPADFGSETEASFLSSGRQYIDLRLQDQMGNVIEIQRDSVLIFEATVGNFAPSNQCLGETTQFNNISFGDDENVASWNWDFGDGNTSNEKSPQHTYQNPGLYEVSLQVNNSSGCENTVEKIVRIGEGPQTNFVVNDINCANGRVVFKDLTGFNASDIENKATIQSRRWIFGDGPELEVSPLSRTEIIKGDSSFYTFIPAYELGQIYEVSLTVTDEIGCATNFSTLISLREQDKPQVDFSFAQACTGAPTQFQDLSVINSDGMLEGIQVDRWEWTFFDTDGVTVLDEIKDTREPAFTFPAPGTYFVKLKAGFSRACPDSLILPVEVQESLESKFTISANTGRAPFTVNFQQENDNASAYVWDFGDGTISADPSPIYTYEEPGIYTVGYIAQNSLGCGTLATQTINVMESPTALPDLAVLDWKVYPNPFREKLVLEIGNPTFQTARVYIYDLLGNLVLEQTLPVMSDSFQLDLSSLPTSLYILRLDLDEQSHYRRIYKQ